VYFYDFLMSYHPKSLETITIYSYGQCPLIVTETWPFYEDKCGQRYKSLMKSIELKLN